MKSLIALSLLIAVGLGNTIDVGGGVTVTENVYLSKIAPFVPFVLEGTAPPTTYYRSDVVKLCWGGESCTCSVKKGSSRQQIDRDTFNSLANQSGSVMNDNLTTGRTFSC